MMSTRNLAAMLPLAALVAAADARTQGPRQAAAAFVTRPAAEQKRVLQVLQTATQALQNPYHDAVRACAESATSDRRARAKVLRTRKLGKGAPEPGPMATDELAVTVRYRFGRGIVEPVHAARRDRERAARQVPVELALSGMLPATDAALAELLRRLDTDTSADRFIGFLESWRNGPESFYQALDRTAGTEDSVFFYDAMLGDFVSMFAKAGQPGAKELRRGLDEAHDALHQAFLAYRQYRAFREAVALLLLLPPDRPLPARLQRYEQHVEGGYSIREQTLMLLAANDYDPRAVIDQLTAAAEPMPQPLWSQPYRTATTFAAVFAEAMPGMIDRAGDTDTFLQRATEQRQQLADEIAVVAAGALRQGASN